MWEMSEMASAWFWASEVLKEIRADLLKHRRDENPEIYGTEKRSDRQNMSKYVLKTV